jgi:hypothetical protein
MATSRSPDAWTASADLFSGRRNPTWDVPAALAHELVKMWSELPPTAAAPSTPPALGYRSCTLRAPDGRVWHATGSIVSAAGAQTSQARRDDTRAWKRRLLETAPDGALPADWSFHDLAE